jgi:hypothetical protein
MSTTSENQQIRPLVREEAPRRLWLLTPGLMYQNMVTGPQKELNIKMDRLNDCQSWSEFSLETEFSAVQWSAVQWSNEWERNDVERSNDYGDWEIITPYADNVTILYYYVHIKPQLRLPG